MLVVCWQHTSLLLSQVSRYESHDWQWLPNWYIYNGVGCETELIQLERLRMKSGSTDGNKWIINYSYKYYRSSCYILSIISLGKDILVCGTFFFYWGVRNSNLVPSLVTWSVSLSCSIFIQKEHRTNI